MYRPLYQYHANLMYSTHVGIIGGGRPPPARPGGGGGPRPGGTCGALRTPAGGGGCLLGGGTLRRGPPPGEEGAPLTEVLGGLSEILISLNCWFILLLGSTRFSGTS